MEGKNSPQDKGKLVYWIFMILGVGSLSAFNSFITADDFFEKYVGDRYSFWVAVVSNAGILPMMLLITLFGDRMSIRIRLLPSFAVLVGVLIAAPFVALVGEVKERMTLAFWLVQALIFISGLATGIVTSTVFSLSSLFPPVYTGAVMFGQGVVGLLVVVIRILTKLALTGESGMVTSTVLYFAIAGFINLLCIVGYFMLGCLPFSKFYMSQVKYTTPSPSTAPEVVVDPTMTVNPTSGLPLDDTEPLVQAAGVPAGEEAAPEDLNAIEIKLKMIGTGGMARHCKCCCGRLFASPAWRWLPTMGYYSTAVFLNFFVTLAIYPSMCVTIPPIAAWLQKDGWMPVLVILDFALLDFVGRLVPSFWVPYQRDSICLAVAIGRLIFVPLLVLSVNPRVIASDVAAFVIVGLMAVSNGLNGTITMMRAAEGLEPKHKGRAGAFNSFVLNIGIFLGSGLMLIISSL
ncbi:Equilibrative Nucleoside Transporter [Paratrimastix pyriformis]|uniref:Equilibrative Nucleoside Transporter n=1 Tax=Paratrimastix pyriformis TaxID=342808 RepID=A0ABQ8UUF7_9EUKA|nr:Equilibrative Nucleoside Transporter [Paratrimastix pyriformis]